MKIKIYIILILACVHFGLISVKAFRNQFAWAEWLAKHETLSKVVEYYSQVTVMQADYSFFSPNIASDLKIEVIVEDENGKHPVNLFDVSNPEVNTRFQCSIIGFQNVSIAQELIARSWAARAYEKYPSAKFIGVRGATYQLPTQREYSSGKLPSYKRMFEITFSTSHGRM
ncbi:hypothetical protein [Chryseosolibacter indicus]|uniref:Uncharacterized protein n=1 Tax=Chryseosolibacter indicus TaxID=2782351 RepID=A0ABS5VW78_9BACT|nr:hypothetical protein [Chryseosolibacter indicus]MBT1705308.1 hypothetical protein [Chryseosolibacter indicus]